MPAALASPQAAAALLRRAHHAWHLHQRQEEMFAPAVGPSEVDLVLPRLLRGVRRRVPSADAGVTLGRPASGRAALRAVARPTARRARCHRSPHWPARLLRRPSAPHKHATAACYKPPHTCAAAGAPSVKEAEAALRGAEAAAAAAALDAAEQAAAAGLDYVPPPGVAVDLSGVARTDTRPLEEQAAALERRAAQRAAAAQLAADRGVQRAAAQRAAAERAADERAAAERAERSARPAAGRQADAGSLAADSAAARRRAAVQRGAPERCAAERHPARAAASGAASPPGLKGMDAWAATEPFQASHAHAAAHASSRTASGMGAGTPARAGSARGRSGQAAAARQQDAGAAFAPGRAGLEGDGGGGRARARAPKARLRLCLQDVGPALVGARLQVLWPEDGRWWPGTVTALNARGRSATLLYETGARVLLRPSCDDWAGLSRAACICPRKPGSSWERDSSGKAARRPGCKAVDRSHHHTRQGKKRLVPGPGDAGTERWQTCWGEKSIMRLSEWDADAFACYAQARRSWGWTWRRWRGAARSPGPTRTTRRAPSGRRPRLRRPKVPPAHIPWERL